MTIRQHVRFLAVFGVLVPAIVPGAANAGGQFFSHQQILRHLNTAPSGQVSRQVKVFRRAPGPSTTTVSQPLRAPGAANTGGQVVFRRAPQPQNGPQFGGVQQFRAPGPSGDPQFMRVPPPRGNGFADASSRGLSVRPAKSVQTASVEKPDNTATDVPEQTSSASNYPDKSRIDLEILFDYDSDRIKPDSVKQLIELGEALNDPSLAKSKIVIAGHTDATGSAGYNYDLSIRRAYSVATFLVEYVGVSRKRLDPEGFGEQYLKYPDAPESGQNRRVEIINLGEAG